MGLLLVSLIFLLTLSLILIRPKGLNEAWATALGGALMLAFRLVTPMQALQTVSQGANVLLFLFGLLILSDLLRASGFFEWAAVHAARAAGGDGRALYRNVFLLGALTTTFLSLDTTAVILTPIVLSFVGRLRLNTLPFLMACAFVANTGSLLLPVSNLTNLLFVSAFHWSFPNFVVRMAMPQFIALVINYKLFRFLFRRDIPEEFLVDDLPQPYELVSDILYFRGALCVLACVSAGYFVGSLIGLQPYIVALTGSAALLLFGIFRKRMTLGILRKVSWSIFPFVIGLFIVVRGVENIGVGGVVRSAVHRAGHSALAQTLTAAVGAGIGSNIINNIPMALLAITSLKAGASHYAQYGALLGCDLGPNLTIAGSLATMLVITSARKQGESVGAKDLFDVGLRVTPVVTLGAAIGLYLSLLIFK